MGGLCHTGTPGWSLLQAKLLAGALWEASVVLIDQLFEDLAGLRRLQSIDREDIANTFVVSGLPPMHAHKYGVALFRDFSWLPRT
jgi:hypothetical protein